jgi:hypothetical protein
MWENACSSDTVTVNSWRETWSKNVRANHKRFGSFKKHSIGKLFQANQNKPAIIVGSGPSLSYNGEHLKENKGILTVSCLHNYHFFEDRGIPVDYYVTLDAGPVVLEEVSEGGKKTPAEYWASTKGKKLVAFIGTDPQLFEKWQGEVYLFNSPIPDETYAKTIEELEPFHMYMSTGGNVLGACMYLAKAIMGSNPVAFIGADFCFSYNQGSGHKFHGWDSKYDASLGQVLRGVDVFGNKVLTWRSYFNFKNFFDYICLQVPGFWVNCTEGGMFGAYPEGNIMAVRQMALKDFISMYQMNEAIRGQCEEPEKPANLILF